jgi:ketopantoate reductase
MIEEHRRRIAIVGSGVLGSQYGEPVRRAKAAGIEMPQVERLYEELKERIAGR